MRRQGEQQPETRRAGLYLRISEDRHDDRLAVTRQRDEGVALMRHRGMQHVDTYVDNDTSARRRRRRPDFARIIADVKSGRLDTIVTLDWARLSRNRHDDLLIFETCQPLRTLIAMARGGDIDLGTAMGRMIADFQSAVARGEIEIKGERHRAQILQAAQMGRAHGGLRAFGYLGFEAPSVENPAGRRISMELDPTEAAFVEQMFTRYLAGAAASDIARWLRENGVMTPRGKPWTADAVKTVLRNPRYAGIRGIRPILNEASGKRADDFIEIAPAQWPAIVTEQTWRAALSRLHDDKLGPEVRRPGRPMRYLLSGIALCGVTISDQMCGHYVIAGSARSPWRRKKGLPAVRSYQCGAKDAGKHLVRQADLIDRLVEQAVIRQLAQPGAIDLLATTTNVDLEAVQREALVTREKLRGLARAYTDGVIDYDQLTIGSTRARTRLAELEAQIAAAGQVDVLAPLVLAENLDTVSDQWAELPMSTKRAVVSRLLDVVILSARRGRPPKDIPFDPATVRITQKRPHADD